MKKLLIALLLLAFPAFGQSVQQSGHVTANHLPAWVTSGVIADGGSSADSPISSIGVTNNGGAGICVSSDRQSAVGRNQLCFGAQTNGPATISLQNSGTAPAEPLNFVVNGAIVTFPTPTSPLGVASGGTGAATAAGARTNLGLGTMSTQFANAVAITGGTITGLPIPTNPPDAATKAYTDGLASGLTIIAPSRLATAAVLPNTPTYANGASGVGATLTAGSNSTLTVDSTVANLNDVVLVNNQAAPAQNGIYTVTTAGSGSVPWVLTRATYFNQASNMTVGKYTFITGGSANINTSWVLSATVTTVGTTAVVFNQFSSTNGVASLGGLTGAITCGASLNCSAGTISNATNGITNSLLAQMSANTIKGNNTGTTANAADLTAAQAEQILQFTQNGTGAVQRLLDAKVKDFISAADFGAVDDNSTDNTPKIQAAINAATVNGRTLYFPLNNTGVYLLNTAFNGSAVLQITAPLRMVCEPGVWLKPSSSITNAQSILYFFGVTGALEIEQARTIVDGCNIGDPTATTRFGNHGIVFDTTNSTTSLMVSPLVENVKITFSNISSHACWLSLVGCAILVTNINTNTSGGTFGAVFQNSMLAGGVSYLNAGDSNAVINVRFPADLTDTNASNQGVYANLISGAGLLLLDNINCQSNNGCLAVDNAASVEVKNSTFEQVGPNVESNTSIIDIGSSVANTSNGVAAVHIIGGSIVSSDCTNHPYLITYNKAVGGFFDGLRLGENCGSYPHAMVSLTALSNNVVIGAGNTWFANGSVTTTTSAQYTNGGTGNLKVTTGTP